MARTIRDLILPRSLLALGPGARVFSAIALVGTALSYGAANICPEQSLILGAGVAGTAGAGCAAFRDEPGRVAHAWLRFGGRVNPLLMRIYRSVAPFAWRWGVLCVVGGLIGGVVGGFGGPNCQ